MQLPIAIFADRTDPAHQRLAAGLLIGFCLGVLVLYFGLALTGQLLSPFEGIHSGLCLFAGLLGLYVGWLSPEGAKTGSALTRFFSRHVLTLTCLTAPFVVFSYPFFEAPDPSIRRGAEMALSLSIIVQSFLVLVIFSGYLHEDAAGAE